MKCVICQHEWTPPPDECPHCRARDAAAAAPTGVSAPYRQQYIATPKTSGLAIAALTLGIFSGLPLAGLVGVVLGIMALYQIGKSGGQLLGKGMAISGIICSIAIPLVFYGTIAAIILPQRSNDDDEWHHAQNCLSNQRQIAMACMLYAQDNNETLPGTSPALLTNETSWQNDLSLSDHVLLCKDSKLNPSYNLAADVSGAALGSVPPSSQVDVLLSADADAPHPGATAAAGLIVTRGDINTTIHHWHYTELDQGFIASYMDGHVGFLYPGNSTLTDAADITGATTAAPVTASVNTVVYQGAQNIFTFDASEGTMEGSAFESPALNTPGLLPAVQYLAIYVTNAPDTGAKHHPTVSLGTEKNIVNFGTLQGGKYYTISVSAAGGRAHTVSGRASGGNLALTIK